MNLYPVDRVAKLCNKYLGYHKIMFYHFLYFFKNIKNGLLAQQSWQPCKPQILLQKAMTSAEKPRKLTIALQGF